MKRPISTLPAPIMAAPSAEEKSRISAFQRGHLEPQGEARARGGADDEEELEHSRDEHAVGDRMRGTGKELRASQGRDHREVEEDRRGRRGAELVRRVQHGGELRHDRDAEEVGKRDPAELDGERLLIGIVGEAGRQHGDDLAHEDERKHEKHELRDELPGEHLVGEARGRR